MVIICDDEDDKPYKAINKGGVIAPSFSIQSIVTRQGDLSLVDCMLHPLDSYRCVSCGGFTCLSNVCFYNSLL